MTRSLVGQLVSHERTIQFQEHMSLKWDRGDRGSVFLASTHGAI